MRAHELVEIERPLLAKEVIPDYPISNTQFEP